LKVHQNLLMKFGVVGVMSGLGILDCTLDDVGLGLGRRIWCWVRQVSSMGGILIGVD
jgi:hypothetical protein